MVIKVDSAQANSSGDSEELPEDGNFCPFGFAVLKKVKGEYTLYEDPDGVYVLELTVNRPYGTSRRYQMWEELSRLEKLFIQLFPRRLDFLAKKLLREEEKRPLAF
ncbi:hypothetical protein LJ655_13280 [Paraburkholderia sp. MMS20-SJTN17]|uniref:Uncharacterized protein n=1 Tax=Paraburkholderia translucens TaxID=2886945 RepID=A0ABS8KDJ7_9BURK|nr:hypothetical protein [Paraburkholderia sp. MMS20-SJTN17]MCC8402847.1 hypothetical protein [Paraburkholderia sp. MMS20-SJTN17]